MSKATDLLERLASIVRASEEISTYRSSASVIRSRILHDWKVSTPRRYECPTTHYARAASDSTPRAHCPDESGPLDFYRSRLGIGSVVPQQENVADLLGGRNLVWVCQGGTLIKAEAPVRLPNAIRIRHRRTAFQHVLRLSQHLRFTIPTESAQQPDALESLLADLQNIQHPAVLEEWLNAIVQSRITLPVGLPPDSPAISLIKRIFQLNLSRGLRFTSNLMRRQRLPFRREHFQLSLIGIVLACSRKRSARRRIHKWVTQQIHRLLKESSVEKPINPTLMAGLLAIGLLAADDTVEAATTLKSQVSSCLELVKEPEERRYFFQFLFDALSQHVSDTNLSDHLVKIIAICSYVADERDVVWPRSGILGLIRDDLISPVRHTIKTAA